MVKVSVFEQPPWKQDIGASQCLDFLTEIIDYNLLKQQPSNTPVLALGVNQINGGKWAPWWRSALSECFASPLVWNQFLKSHFVPSPPLTIQNDGHHKLKTSRGWTPFFSSNIRQIMWEHHTFVFLLFFFNFICIIFIPLAGGGGAWIPKWTEFPPNTSLRDRLRLSTPPSRRAPKLVTDPF